jgi:hypothetical protein
MFSNFFFSSKIVPFMTMWKNIVERGRPTITVWCTRIACWISKTKKKTHTHIHTHTHTPRLCNTHWFSTATVGARTRLSVTLYVHCLSCFVLTLHIVRVLPSLGDMTCACNFLSVTETLLQSIVPTSVNTSIVSNIMNVFVVSNFGILPSCPIHFLLWTSGHHGWYLYFNFYLSYLCFPRERPGAHCTGGWVGPRAGLDRCGKSRPHRNSIPGPSSP